VFGYCASLLNPPSMKMGEEVSAGRGPWLEGISRYQGVDYGLRIFDFTTLQWRKL
jgi:hypothetical protein